MTTHYEKIQALGNRMASNLETMGVSASFSDGGLTLADKILEIQHFTDGLLLWADKDIIQTGDTVNFCALLLEDKKAVSGETILFKGLETTQTLVANTETSVGNQYKFINLPTMTDFSQRVYLNEEQTIYITKGQQDINYFIWIPGTPSGYFVPIDNDSDIIVENGVIKLKSNHSDWTYDASATNTNKITSTISDVTITETMQGTTGSDGVATVSYTGKGTGKLNIQAKYGIISSEIYELMDCLFYDEGLPNSHKSDYTNSGITVSYDPDGTKLTPTSTSSSTYTLNQTVIESMCVEFDFRINTRNGNNIRFFIGGANIYYTSTEMDDGNIHHFKAIVNGESITATVDDVSVGEGTRTSNTAIRFVLANECVITFKNLKVYPI